MIERSFELDQWHMRDDGRTVEGRIVPYGEVIEALDMGDDGKLERIKETFLPGSLTWEAQNSKRRGNAAWVEFRLDHGEDFSGTVGYGRTIESREDGAYASFRLYESPDLPKVQSMLRESHTGLSVMFADKVEPRTIDGVIQRVQVALRHVCATPTPAYSGAQILTMREAKEHGGTPFLDEVNAMLQELKGVTA
jgi:HK97 family phage prohead protease